MRESRPERVELKPGREMAVDGGIAGPQRAFYSTLLEKTTKAGGASQQKASLNRKRNVGL